MALPLVHCVLRGRMFAQSAVCMMVAMRRPVILMCTRKMRQFNYSDAHMNELPIPKGSFKDYSEERRFVYAIVLGIGILIFLLSFIALLLFVDFNSGIPSLDTGPEPECYVMNYTGPQDDED